MFRAGPPAAHLEIRTPSDYVGLVLQDVALNHADGVWAVAAQDGDHVFTGTSDTLEGAFLALLADRLGLVATVTMKTEERSR